MSENFEKIKKQKKSFSYEGRDGKRAGKGDNKREKKRSRNKEKESFIG